MALNINGTTGISGVDGSASAPVFTGNDSNTGISFGTDIVNINTGGTTRLHVNENGFFGIGTTTPDKPFEIRTETASHEIFAINRPASGTAALYMGNDSSNNAIIAANNVDLIIGHDFNGTLTKRAQFKTSNEGFSYGFGVIDKTYTEIRGHSGTGVEGVRIRNDGSMVMGHHSGVVLSMNRRSTDGTIVNLRQNGSTEGSITVSGSTVSFNGGHLSRWSQFKGLSNTDKSARPTIYQGTVMSNLDDLCVWEGEENQQLNMTKVSDVEGDKDVAGVFYTWDDEDEDEKYLNDFFIAMTGDLVIRVAASTTVARGDLLISAGDGTAKPQADDIVRSSTIAKIVSTNHTATYPDGSKAYPCVLMAC